MLHDLIHHSHPDGAAYPLDECPLAGGFSDRDGADVHEEHFVRRDGQFVPAVCSASPIRDADRLVGTVIEARDLTDEKRVTAQLRESETRFSQLADAIPQLAWMAGPDGHIDWYNKRWYEYTGTTLEQMEGWGWQSVHDPDVLPQVLERWQVCLETAEPFDMVFPLRGGDGVFRPFLTRVVPFRDASGTIVRWFGTNTDISDQKRAQEELRIIAARLSEADRRKDEFLATLAHELRNPLAPIRTGLEALRLAGDDPIAQEQIRQTMERQTEQMVHLIDDLLDVSRITQGKLQLRLSRVDLKLVVESAVEAARPVIDEGGHELRLTLPAEPVLLEADPTRLAQMLSNLLNNAAKYSPTPGTIALAARTDDDDEVVITVTDTGLGIAPEMQTRIFEMFGQVDQTLEKSYTGLGIGLTLVKTLAKMHGGTIAVHSEGVGRGSEFTLRLPTITDVPSASPASLADEGSNGTAGTTNLRVLIVDDNVAAATMLTMVVKMLGNQTRTAHDGREAVEVAAEFVPDMILMDLGMPKMNGYEAARKIRSQPWGRSMMLVALTGWGQEEDKQKTKEAGFDHHLVKPAEPDALKKLFHQVAAKSAR